MTEPIEQPIEQPARDTVMDRHFISWHLKCGTRWPVGVVVCQAFPRDPCRQSGPWQEDLGLPADLVDHTTCWATAWLESAAEAGASVFWAGAVDTHLTSGPINVAWDGSDWVWWYTDERRAPTNVIPDLGDFLDLSDLGENVRP
jgi:hypothetical protein